MNSLSNGYAYEYFLKDHLGNTRSGFSSDVPTIAKFVSNYYPFGLSFGQGVVTTPKNRYFYNGKELQDGSNLYDYGARSYDPVIGRWGSVDPLAESYNDESPYNYVGNGPINQIDPNGTYKFELNGHETFSTRYVDPDGNTLLNTDDGRLDVYEVPWSRVDEFKNNVYWNQLNNPSRTDSKGWNDVWRDQLTQTISESTIKKAGINYLSSEKSQAAAIQYLYGSISFEAFVWEEVKAQWNNPANVAMSLTAFAHGSLGMFRSSVKGIPKPSPKFKKPTNLPQLPLNAVPEVMTIRIMKPTAQYPNGYWILEKPMPQGGAQGINPSTMKPGARNEIHVPLPKGSGQTHLKKA